MCRRFTEEIFAALISVIFIIEAITAVVKLYTEPPPGSPDDQSAAFLGTMLCFGTYGLAMQLRSIKVRFFLFTFSMWAISMMSCFVYSARVKYSTNLCGTPWATTALSLIHISEPTRPY